MRLAPHEFIRRFLLHVLPDGFHRIRHCGFLAKGDRGDRLERVRALLAARSSDEPNHHPSEDPTSTASTGEDAAPPHGAACPECGRPVRRIARPAPVNANPFRCDTS